MTPFEMSLEALDPVLFRDVPASLSEADKRSLLAVQKAVRASRAPYAYLEIGSHFGGSIQPYLRDESCGRIYSIDPRPTSVADDRGETIRYADNSSAHMLDLLRAVRADRLDHITIFDCDARQIPTRVVEPRPAVCFIDGEHTNEAVRSDFNFCRSVVAEHGVILFHDANVVYQGLQEILQDLTTKGVAFTAYVLPSVVFVIELGPGVLSETEDIRRMLRQNGETYLLGLASMEHYRSVYNRPAIRFLRNLYRRYAALRRRIGA